MIWRTRRDSNSRPVGEALIRAANMLTFDARAARREPTRAFPSPFLLPIRYLGIEALPKRSE
jgi:hypothetical protein